ncbi:MAG: hypothetical protein NC428_04615 [Clostridium sp.]|nr:hypothetical protein [Clostridium sp.]
MLNFFQIKNTWNPPQIAEDALNKYYEEVPDDYDDYLVILQTKPYIDALYVHYDNYVSENPMYSKRFVFKENYVWDYEDEQIYIDRCLNNSRCGCKYACIEEIYKYYSEKYPDWKLSRYYTKPFRLLDHLYHCMRKGTAKEMLYKAGLDELAAGIEEMDEINLMASKPSEIYEGISMRTLRTLNCKAGASLLSRKYNREFIKKLQMKFPEIFKERMNDAQCNYLNYLITGELAVGEAGRLFKARKVHLMMLWNDEQYEMFLR